MAAPTAFSGHFRLGAHRMTAVMRMDPCTITAAVTALANALASRFDDESLSLLSAMLVQLGDTLATIAARRSICNATGQVGK